jgi:hypothetical protein
MGKNLIRQSADPVNSDITSATTSSGHLHFAVFKKAFLQAPCIQDSYITIQVAYNHEFEYTSLTKGRIIYHNAMVPSHHLAII